MIMKLSKLPLLTLLLLIACSESVTDSGNAELPRELTKTEKAIVQADRSFSIKMFKELAVGSDEENVFISPLSISMALGMTLNGANGQTFDEIQSTLELHDLSLPEINEGYSSLKELLTDLDPKVQMEIGNSIWSRQGFQIEEDFSSNLTNYFDAESSELDFNDPESVNIINNWVQKKTHGKINEIIESIPSGMIMYLINAVYFKGDWVYEFDPEKTTERNFYKEDGQVKKVDMMTQKLPAKFYSDENIQMIDLPYGNGLFTMSLIKPTSDSTPIDSLIETDLSLENLEKWYGENEKDTVDIFLPKLELSYEKSLNQPLENMGMPIAFTNQADFSNINRNGGLTISEVKHKTYLKLDEEGTEAAAVTSVGIGTTSVGPNNPVFNFNRSYVMILREKESGTILFIGKVGNPEN
jgi:serpin B